MQANRQPIRLEIENSNLSFYTFIAVRPEFLVIAKPQDIDEDALRIGRMARFTIPDGSGKVVRMKILDPSHKRTRGEPVIVCDFPTGFAKKTKRTTERFNTSHFKNLQLLIPQFSAKFRIIDISEQGCKTFVGNLGDEEAARLGAPMRFTKVSIGHKLEIELDILTPRFIKPPTVSFEWGVRSVGNSAAALSHLLETLHSREMGRLKSKEERRPPDPMPEARVETQAL